MFNVDVLIAVYCYDLNDYIRGLDWIYWTLTTRNN
jgi:hypothetical protein